MRARDGLWGMVALALAVVPAAGSKADQPTCSGAPATIKETEEADLLFGDEGDDVI